MKVKGLSWVGVGTDDFPETLRFFTQVLGLEVEAQEDGQALLRIADGQQLEIFGREGRGKSLNSPPTVAFEVEDVATAREELLAAGVELVGDVGSWNGHEWLYFHSPDGHVFEVKKTPTRPVGGTTTALQYSYEFVHTQLPEGAQRLLEVGCGDGALAARLQDDGFKLMALDSDPACVEAARARGVDARLATWPDFSETRFDAVLFTRSLHHVEDLEGGVRAAFGCLEPGGSLIVEDFDFAFDDEPTFCWFRALLRTWAAAGLPLEGSGFLSALSGSDGPPLAAWHDEHHHHLHSAAAIEAALRAEAGSVRVEPAAYFFRYVAGLPGASEALVQPLLDFELMAIRQGHIAPLGRRFVAEHEA